MSQGGKLVVWVAAACAAFLAVLVILGVVLVSGMPDEDTAALVRGYSPGT